MIKTHFKDTQDDNFDYSFVGIFLGLGGNFAYGQKYWGYFTQIAFLAFFPSPHVAKKRYTYILLEARGILYSSLVFH